jgi:N-carbamoyl-L-amino-acid hydrolase
MRKGIIMFINLERLKENLYELSRYSEAGKGITRRCFTDAYDKGLAFVRDLMEKAGLNTRIDSVGNLIGRQEGKYKGHPAIIMGSHIDTVPNGGMFDGAVGVLAGIEVVRTLREYSYSNIHPVEVISFYNEEGSAPALTGGTLGSRIMMRVIDINSFLLDNLKKINLSEENLKSAYRDPSTIKNYLELHIEQGRILYDQKIQIGIVTGIVGKKRFLATVKGKANHAGTTPMYARDDALLKALPLIKGVNDIVKQLNNNLVGTVGNIVVKPGVQNVIPGEVEVTIEFRDLEFELIDKAVARIHDLIIKIGDTEIIQVEAKNSSLMDKNVQGQIEKACKLKSLTYKYMPSGAGHDARELAKRVPSGLIFIPSIEGVSHTAEEMTDFNDINNGATVLLETFKLLDNE